MATRREKILQKLNPNLLKMTPKLSSSENSFIDLNAEDSTETGVKKLMMKFFRNQDLCEKNRRNPVQTETELITHSAKYNENNEICKLLSERLTLPSTAHDEDEVSDRPGRKLQKLRMELQEKMSAKWEEEYKKRIEEKKVYYKTKSKFKKKNSVDDVNDNVQDDDDDDDYDYDASKKKKTFEKDVNKKFENKNYDDGDDADIEFEDYEESSESDNESTVNDKKIDENGYEGNQENDFEENDDYESCSLIPAYQPGGGMLYGGSELTQCDEELPQDLLSPSLRLSLNESSSFTFKMSSEFHSSNDLGVKKVEISSIKEADNSFTVQPHSVKLFSQNSNDSFDLNDAFEFCSGKFPGEQSESQLGIQSIFENINDNNKNKSDDDFDNDFSNTLDEENIFEDLKPQKVFSKGRKNIIAFEDSEEEDKEVVNDTELDEVNQYHTAAPQLLLDDGNEIVTNKIMVNKKKTIKSLHFSDEEDAANNCKGEELVNDKSDEEGNSEKENEDDNFEEEKNENDQRSVYYDSEENEIINPKEFFEKEAELSGSEWSGDEDEKGLDEFDVEDGDADIIDNDEVRSQLEKIHIRRVLDDDAREVRFIQEILFEDGDLHSDGKRRDRKFKWKNLGTFDEQDGENGSKENDGNGSDDNEVEEEEELRKSRHEKELFFMTKKKDDDLNSDDDIIEDFHSVKVTQIRTSVKLGSSKQNEIENSNTNCTEIFKTTYLSACNARGSFLTRNEQFLSRLARATSAITDNVLGPKNTKNFVFTMRSPEKTNPDRNLVCKRQVEDMKSCSRREKKIKLLSPEAHMGPSILDLLV